MTRRRRGDRKMVKRISTKDNNIMGTITTRPPTTPRTRTITTTFTT